MKQNPFKVGDRVRIFWSTTVGRAVTMDTEITSSERDIIQVMENDVVSWFHWKQCRKLKPGQRKITWFRDCIEYLHKGYYEDSPTTRCSSCTIHKFREVRK